MSARTDPREIDRLLESLGLTKAVHTRTNGSHGKATFLCLDGKERWVLYSTTKYEGRGIKNVLAQVKRAARGVDYHNGYDANRASAQ
jgi:hypothetical protein